MSLTHLTFCPFGNGLVPPTTTGQRPQKFANRESVIGITFDPDKKMWTFSNITGHYLDDPFGESPMKLASLAMQTELFLSFDPSRVSQRRSELTVYSTFSFQAKWEGVPDVESFGKAIAGSLNPACNGEKSYCLSLSCAQSDLGKFHPTTITFIVSKLNY